MKGSFWIAEFEIEPQLNSIRKGCDVSRLEPKMMQVLLELAAQPGEVLSKDALIRAVWADTFVGDDVLIRCISELRRIFHDDPRSPRVIQTIPKVGYRLIADVRTVPPVEEPAVAVSAPAAAAQPALASPPAISPAEVPQPDSAVIQRANSSSKLLLWAAGAVIILLLITAGLLAYSYLRKPLMANFRTIPFTSYPGSERQPVFSPDGNQIAFTWNGESGGDAWNIYVKLIGSETPLRLTSTPYQDLSPAWSPDGKWVAFIRHSEQANAVYLVPAIGGGERKLYDLHGNLDWDDPGLSWSHDGKYLVFPDGKSQENPSAIYQFSMESHEVKQLTHPLNSWDGDYGPAYSPDGLTLAFVRGADVGSRNIYMMDARGGEPKQLTTSGRYIYGFAWAVTGDAIVFSSDIGGTASLWRVPVDGSPMERVPFGTDKVYNPAFSPKGDRFAYSKGYATWSLLRLNLKSRTAAPVKLASSTEQDSAAKFSPDGKRIAFQSWRSGAQEIWTCTGDGTSPVKLTSFDGPLTGSPSWSPDSRQIAFDSRPGGRSHIYVISADGGTPRALTDGEFNDVIPNWSRDSKFLYFGSKRNGSWQLWRVAVDSGALQQVTSKGGFVGAESSDGKWVFYTKYDVPGLWRIPSGGGEETKLLDGPPVSYWGYWNLTQDGIYYLAEKNGKSSIFYKSFSSDTQRVLYTYEHAPARFSGITISPDEKSIVYSDYSSVGNNIILVENIR